MIIGRSSKVIAQFKKGFIEHYNIKDMGLIKDYLGIELIRDGSKSITLSQRAYFEKVLQKFKMDNANPRSTPI